MSTAPITKHVPAQTINSTYVQFNPRQPTITSTEHSNINTKTLYLNSTENSNNVHGCQHNLCKRQQARIRIRTFEPSQPKAHRRKSTPLEENTKSPSFSKVDASLKLRFGCQKDKPNFNDDDETEAGDNHGDVSLERREPERMIEQVWRRIGTIADWSHCRGWRSVGNQNRCGGGVGRRG